MEHNLKTIFQKYGTLLALVVLFIFFSVVTDTFFTPFNLINILAHMSMLTIIATGLTICMVPDDFDMSIASVASLSSVIVATLLLKGFSLFTSLAITVLMGATFGFVAGFLITTVKISAFIATLALGSIATGITFMYTRGQEVFGMFSDSFLFLGQGFIFKVIPAQLVIMLVIILLFSILMGKSKMGRWMYAIGGSVRAAYLSGIRVNRYRIVGMVISGALAAFTGCILAARLGSGQPTAGDAFLLDAIAAAFLGMTMFKNGRPNIPGTFVGALILGMIDNGLVLMGVSYFFQNIAKGIIIIFAVGITSRSINISEK